MQAQWYPAPAHLQSALAGGWSLRSGTLRELSARVIPDGNPSVVWLIPSSGDEDGISIEFGK